MHQGASAACAGRCLIAKAAMMTATANKIRIIFDLASRGDTNTATAAPVAVTGRPA